MTSTRAVLGLLLISVFTLAVSAMAYTFARNTAVPSTVGWGQFLQNISDGQVTRIVQDRTTLMVTDAAGKTYTVAAPGLPDVNSDYRIDFERAAASGGRTFDDSIYTIEPVTDNSWIGLLLTGLLPVLVIGTFFYSMTRMARRQATTGSPFGLRPPMPTLADRLRQLEQARDAGLITAEEYDAKRRQILDAS